jgi:nucleotide-binding universal stress UspA family protein
MFKAGHHWGTNIAAITTGAVMVSIRQILVPTDFSDPAGAALNYARALAEEFHSHLHIFHVVPEPYVYPWGTEISTLPLADLLAQSETLSNTRLAELIPKDQAPAGGLTTSTAIGTPVDRILDYINDSHIDLVVMGTHGRGPVGHLLLGSVAERMVRRSPVPVLTVKGEGDSSRPD